jgi:hypothetical protein
MAESTYGDREAARWLIPSTLVAPVRIAYRHDLAPGSGWAGRMCPDEVCLPRCVDRPDRVCA